MQMDIQHSIRTWLANKTGLTTTWIYDGVKLPTVKPFLTIEQMQNNISQVSKLRETMLTTYRFQVGLFASSSSERARLQEQVKNLLMFEDIPLIIATTPAETVGSFYAQVTAEVPIPAEDVSSTTNFHHLYFDIEVEITQNRRNN